MSQTSQQRTLSARDMEAILAVTSKLATPFDLLTMLAEVVNAAKQVLGAEGGSVWLYEAATDELVLRVASEIEPIRVPAGSGIVGACAQDRQVINVPDCYADPRFNRDVDRRSGFRTRCMLTLPLVDHKDVLVGVMQVLNKTDGAFNAADEMLATALAAQCAMALQRVQLTEAMLEGEKLRQELEMARIVQMSTLPSRMPEIAGYSVFGMCRPAGITGGDTFDLALIDQGLLTVLGDATGHGIGPALSVTQMQAMLRIAFRLGADLESAFIQVNNQLSDTLPDDRFITAFIGLLDTATHNMRFHSGGQGPILHFQAATGDCALYKPTSFPLAAMPLKSLRPTVNLALEPGDILVLISDGIYEYENAAGEPFGEDRVRAFVAANRGQCATALGERLVAEVEAFASGAPQEDDMTIVFVKRELPTAQSQSFARSIGALQGVFGFTAAFVQQQGVDPGLLATVDFVVEELFTNMVKYSVADDPQARIRVEMSEVTGGIEVTLTDFGVDRFDMTQAPDAKVDLPIDERRPGGLGLHLIRRLVDAWEYEYLPERRESRVRFRRTTNGPAQAGQNGKAGEESC